MRSRKIEDGLEQIAEDIPSFVRESSPASKEEIKAFPTLLDYCEKNPEDLESRIKLVKIARKLGPATPSIEGERIRGENKALTDEEELEFLSELLNQFKPGEKVILDFYDFPESRYNTEYGLQGYHGCIFVIDYFYGSDSVFMKGNGNGFPANYLRKIPNLV